MQKDNIGFSFLKTFFVRNSLKNLNHVSCNDFIQSFDLPEIFPDFFSPPLLGFCRFFDVLFYKENDSVVFIENLRSKKPIFLLFDFFSTVIEVGEV